MKIPFDIHSHAWDLATAATIFGGFLLAALIVRLIGTRLFAPLLRYIGMESGHSVFTPLRDLVFWGILVSGLYEALSSLEGLETRPHLVLILDRGNAVLWAFLVINTLLKVFNRSIAWYLQRAAQRTGSEREVKYQATLLRRIVNVVVILLGVIYILRASGIDTTPLLASSAISGVAVAFAAQDTVANLFAGFYLTLDKPIRVGDFMRLETGQEGTVEEIGWRNTRIRLLANTTVIIPNSKLSQSVFTNYDLPQSDMNLVVPCRVALDSDVEHVERVTLEVAREVLGRIEGAVAEWTPLVLWREFGENGMLFNVVLRIKTFPAQFALQSAFVKTLHQRFQKEAIKIPYQTTTLVYSEPTRIKNEAN